jgi:nitrous oxidase accessory protein NosD
MKNLFMFCMRTIKRKAMTTRNIHYLIRIFLFIVFGFLILEFAQAITISVEPGESIQTAIDEARPGDILEVRSGIYRENIDINKCLTLRGIDSGGEKPTIIGGDEGSKDLITLSADGCILRGFVINGFKNNPLVILSNSNIVSDNL